MPANMTPRRIPPPWSVEEQAACFVVRESLRERQFLEATCSFLGIQPAPIRLRDGV